MNNGIFYGVSVGPGDPELMTLKAVKAIENSQVIVAPKTDRGSTVALDIAGGVINLEGKEIVEMTVPMLKGHDAALAAYETGARDIVKHLKEGKNVSLLNLGDISIYSTFGYIFPIVEEENCPVEIIAGVPSFCAAAAKFKVSLTDRDLPLHIVPANYGDVKEHLAYPGTKVLMKAGKVLEKIKEELNARESYEYALLAENVGLPNETLKKLQDGDSKNSYFTTVLVKD